MDKSDDTNGNDLRKRHGSTPSRKSCGSDKQMAKSAKEVLAEFCESSTIHGMKYIGRRPLREKYVYYLMTCNSWYD